MVRSTYLFKEEEKRAYGRRDNTRKQKQKQNFLAKTMELLFRQRR